MTRNVIDPTNLIWVIPAKGKGEMLKRNRSPSVGGGFFILSVQLSVVSIQFLPATRRRIQDRAVFVLGPSDTDG